MMVWKQRETSQKTGSTLISVLILGLGLLSVETAKAEPWPPYRGMFIGPEIGDILTYHCKKGSPGEILCLLNNLTFEKSMLTGVCSVQSYQFERTFVATKSGDWTASDVPSGPCLIEDKSRFIHIRGKGPLSVYNFESRREVNDKTNTDFLPCGELTEESVLYRWDQGAVFKGCVFFDWR